MGKIPRQRQLTGCRRRLPLHQATSCSCSMHLTLATMGARALILTTRATRGKMKTAAAATIHRNCNAVCAQPRATPSP